MVRVSFTSFQVSVAKKEARQDMSDARRGPVFAKKFVAATASLLRLAVFSEGAIVYMMPE